MTENNELLNNVLSNEEISIKFFEIETKILSINNFKDLFEKLLSLIEQKFLIPHVWISIVSDDNEFNFAEVCESSHLLKDRLSFIERDSFIKLIDGEAKPKLINDSLKPYYRLLPENQKYLLKSLAVVPLTFDGKIIGSLNMGDYSIFRFQPAMGVFFLSQLGVKISICISNIYTIEKLTQLIIRNPVTHLLNGNEMEYMLKREFKRSARYGFPITLLLLNIDDFKMGRNDSINQYEIRIVKYIADNLMAIMRGEDTIFQLSQAKFAIVLPDQGPDQALKLSKRINTFFDKHPLKIDTATLNLSMRFAIASTKHTKINNPSALIDKANERLNKVTTLMP